MRQAKLGIYVQGESPYWVRSSQPPIPSVALKLVTTRRSVHRESYRPQGIPLSLKNIQPRYIQQYRWRQTWIIGSQYKEIGTGEISEGLSGSKHVVCM